MVKTRSPSSRWELLLLVSSGTAAAATAPLATTISTTDGHLQLMFADAPGRIMGHVEDMFPEASMDSPVCSILLPAACLCCSSIFERRESSPVRPSPRLWPLFCQDFCSFGGLAWATSGEGVFLYKASEDEIYLQLELQRSQRVHSFLRHWAGESLPRSRELLERHAQGTVGPPCKDGL